MSALADAIAGEEAAIYAYGLAGARLASTDRDRALGGLAAHRARLLQLRELAGTSALPGAPGGYDVAPPADEPQARALLADVESRRAATYADLAAALLLPNPMARQMILEAVDPEYRLRQLVVFLLAEVNRAAKGDGDDESLGADGGIGEDE